MIHRSLAETPDDFGPCAITIGNFDGVHLGHQQIVSRLLAQAQSLGAPSLVLTFDPHPAQLLRPQQAPMPLSETEYKARLLCDFGVDAVVAYPTDSALLTLSASDFFQRIVLGHLQARGLVEGRNFFFGHDRGGDIEVLARFCRDAGIRLDVVEPAQIDGNVVSSSRVRKLIAAGEVAEAAKLLGRPYRIRGAVIHGQGRGDRLGFPTANVGGIETLLPGQGIYAGRAMIDGRSYVTAMSLGGNPTFDESDLKVEAFLLDFHGDLYGRAIEIDFLQRLRDIKRFDSVPELVEQMARDVQQTRGIALSFEP